MKSPICGFHDNCYIFGSFTMLLSLPLGWHENVAICSRFSRPLSSPSCCDTTVRYGNTGCGISSRGCKLVFQVPMPVDSGLSPDASSISKYCRRFSLEQKLSLNLEIIFEVLLLQKWKKEHFFVFWFMLFTVNFFKSLARNSKKNYLGLRWDQN